MKIGTREIVNFGTPYILAEIGSNHNGDMALAKRLIDRAKAAGCDCVKFQSWTKKSIFSKGVYEQNYFLKDDYRSRTDHTLESIVETYSISERQLLKMRDYCRSVRIDFGSTPFSKREVDYLVNELEASFIKVASMDLNNYPFLEYIAATQKPVVLSTGLSSLEEIRTAVRVIENTGNRQLVLLHCVADYPPRDRDVNLNNMDMLRNIFPNYAIGFSDHTLGTAVPLAAVAKGACMIEKHFTLDRNMPGWDHKVSATPEEMATIVADARRIHEALGAYKKTVSEGEVLRRPAYRRSIVAARDIPQGKTIENEDLDFKRPGTGLAPGRVKEILGKKAKHFLAYDELLSLSDVD